jgi:SAM-dependent methyltransferase
MAQSNMMSAFGRDPSGMPHNWNSDHDLLNNGTVSWVQGRENAHNFIKQHALHTAAANGTRILDMGCGNGAFIHTLLSYAPDARIVGVEKEPALCAKAVENLRTHTPSAANLVIRADFGRLAEFMATATSRLGGRPQVIVCYDCLHLYQPERQAELLRIWSVFLDASKGSRIIFTTIGETAAPLHGLRVLTNGGKSVSNLNIAFANAADRTSVQNATLEVARLAHARFPNGNDFTLAFLTFPASVPSATLSPALPTRTSAQHWFFSGQTFPVTSGHTPWLCV